MESEDGTCVPEGVPVEPVTVTAGAGDGEDKTVAVAKIATCGTGVGLISVGIFGTGQGKAPQPLNGPAHLSGGGMVAQNALDTVPLGNG